MALPTSGPITFAMINKELGHAENTPISLNQADVRALAGKLSGAISFADLRGKSAIDYSMTIRVAHLHTTQGTASYETYGFGTAEAHTIDDSVFALGSLVAHSPNAYVPFACQVCKATFRVGSTGVVYVFTIYIRGNTSAIGVARGVDIYINGTKSPTGGLATVNTKHGNISIAGLDGQWLYDNYFSKNTGKNLKVDIKLK